MVNLFAAMKPIVVAVMNLAAGVTPQKVDIEPGTTMNFWVPTEIANRNKNQSPKMTMKSKNNKPAVVFLHGFFSDGILTWLFQVLALTREYDVYVPDLLFFGSSITDNPDRSVSFQAECLAKGLRKLGVERCTVVGFSYGGLVGFELAKMHPDLVESVIITGSMPQLTESISKAVMESIQFSSWQEFLLPETGEEVRVLLSIGSHNKTLSRLPRFVYRDFLEEMYPNRKERAELLKAAIVPDDEVVPTEYSQKIHLLWGAEDRVINVKIGYDTKRELGEEATLQCIENAGHTVHLDRPFVYNHHLKKLLASLHM